MNASLSLPGAHVRLEPLNPTHVTSLAEASRGGAELYAMSFVPQTQEDVRRYVETALAWAQAGTAVPLVIIRQHDDAVIGTTRFFNIEHWARPRGHDRGTNAVDTCEIGYTWLSPTAIRSSANTEAKLLMLTQAFETWGARSVCFHTDARNTRSRAAIERIGAQFEGILRAHRLATDFSPRDSARYSILIHEWPAVKARLTGRLLHH